MQQMTADEHNKLLVLILVCIIFSIGFAIVLNTNPFIRHKSDIFFRWYATTKLFSEGRNLYDSQNTQDVTMYVYGYLLQTNFYYPAHLILFTGPLALLPYPAAHLIWTIAVQIFFIFSLLLSIRLVNWPKSINGITIVLAMSTIFFIPYLQHTIWGQFNTIGVLSLVLCYQALRNGRYGLAGVWAAGLTFKPHTTALTLLFLLIWALFERERWHFYLGFALSSLAMWATAEFFQPGWVLDFLATLGEYGTTHSVVDHIWNPHQIVATTLVLAALTLFLHNRRATAQSPAFIGCLSFSLALWSLLVPVIGMLHIVALPIAAVMILSDLEQSHPPLYTCALYSILLVYILGIVGFLWGLSSPDLYGKHIVWSELAYKITAPIIISLFALPLCLRSCNLLARAKWARRRPQRPT